MITAVGYSENEFSIDDPGRLCRGRERWIEPWPVDEEDDTEAIFRGVISGALFEDDSARDALRGVQHSGLDVVEVVAAILGEDEAIAFMEDGHPADMPEEADRIEAYTGYRYGGTRNEALVRWTVECKGPEMIRRLMGDDPNIDLVRGFVVPGEDADMERLYELIFLLTGMSTLDSPPARYQPAAIPEVLEEAELLVLLHRDKHGPAVGVYAAEHVDLAEILEPLAKEAKALMVPFAIPPMLARWDRALGELRSRWDEEADGPFPVPSAPEGSGWQSRRRRRRKKKEERRGEARGEDAEDDELDEVDDKPRKRKKARPTSPDDEGVLEISDFDDDGVLEIGD